MRKEPHISFEEKRNSEKRKCPLCGYTIENPFTYRCPRCNTSLPFEDPGCGKCVHSPGCPVADIRTKTKK